MTVPLYDIRRTEYHTRGQRFESHYRTPEDDITAAFGRADWSKIPRSTQRVHAYAAAEERVMNGPVIDMQHVGIASRLADTDDNTAEKQNAASRFHGSMYAPKQSDDSTQAPSQNATQGVFRNIKNP